MLCLLPCSSSPPLSKPALGALFTCLRICVLCMNCLSSSPSSADAQPCPHCHTTWHTVLCVLITSKEGNEEAGEGTSVFIRSDERKELVQNFHNTIIYRSSNEWIWALVFFTPLLIFPRRGRCLAPLGLGSVSTASHSYIKEDKHSLLLVFCLDK